MEIMVFWLKFIDFVPDGPIHNEPSMVQIMVRRGILN